jgi:hypothetical protein
MQYEDPHTPENCSQLGHESARNLKKTSQQRNNQITHNVGNMDT